MLRKLFGKNKIKRVPFDASLMQVDMHNHILFGIDDGARVIDDSLAMLEVYEALGFRKVIASPHIMTDEYKNSPETINPPLERLKEKAADFGIEMAAAAEYYLDEGFEEKLDKDEILCFHDKHLLFECSMQHEPANLQELVFAMSLKGYQPVFAHPERYWFMHDDKLSKYQKLIDMGVKFQLNLLSFKGHYGPEIKAMAEKLVEADMFHVIGSDAHHVKHLALLKNLEVPEKLMLKLQEGKLMNTQI